MHELRQEALARLSADQLQAIERMVEGLEQASIRDRAVKVGERGPDFALPNQSGELVELARLLERGPVVVVFYRGGWCPYCNLQLRSYQAVLSEIHARGAALLAISPQRPDESLSSAEKNALSFDVLSDVGNSVSRAYGLTFSMPDEMIQSYLQRGRDLRVINDAPDWELPVPATLIIDRDGIVRLSHVDVDHRDRLDPRVVVDALRDLVR